MNPVLASPRPARAPSPALDAVAEAALAERVCQHCFGPIAASAERADGYCSDGCAAVHALLEREGLLRYYELAPEARAPATPPSAKTARTDRAWLEQLARSVRAGDASRLRLDVQGLQCAGCVWLLEELFRREPDALRVEVNPALGCAELIVGPRFPLPEYVAQVEAFGYALGPANKTEDARERDLLLRLGVCAAVAMNAMIFSLPLYLGLTSGPVHAAFRGLSLALGTVSLLVGGSVFVRSAWRALRQRLLHLDLPIALGVLLAYVGSSLNFLRGNDRGTYFDTLSLFIALMLAGRWLQERALSENRRRLLADDGAEGLLTRTVDAQGSVQVVRCGALRAGDTVLLAPGDLLPVDGALDDEGASCSLEWIRGESDPVAFSRGDTLPAGAFLASAHAVRVTAATDFAASPLRALLRTPARAHDGAKRTAWWQTLSRWYAIGVLVVAALGFLGWFLATGSLGRALEVTTAVLVVTCPCAFGLATPLAYELAHAGLRRAGLFVRTAGLLDRATALRTIAFDKTGTLTTGALGLRDDAPLARLRDDDRAALYDMTARSGHPKSAAVRAGLERTARAHLALRPGARAEEVPGSGVELTCEGARYRLGTRAFALGADATTSDGDAGELCFSRDGALVASLATTEVLRDDARAELAALRADGYAIEILSGDAPDRVARVAALLGVLPAQAHGALRPDDKAARVRAHPAGAVLMLGDGVNDAPAFAAASCAGTPAIDRPFVPTRADFYFTTAGLRPVRLLLRVAHALARVHRQNLAIALAYNGLTVGLALAGEMSPLLCAGLMPLSSLLTLAATGHALGARRTLWKS